MDGNIFTENIEGINVHRYGAHIFHTSNKHVWEFINQFSEFNNYINSPIANYNGKLYNLPFNMNTFNKLWGVITPEEAREKIKNQINSLRLPAEPKNLEEQALSLVGTDIYEKLIKGYTEKQWGRKCTDLPAEIIKRIPCRFTYNNNYFNDPFQGIPIGGYTPIIEKMLKNSDVLLNTDYFNFIETNENVADFTIFTGSIDRFFNYCYGKLQYRTVYFETKILENENFQGVAVMNFTDNKTPYTRIIEHKHFEFGKQPKTVISYEYPTEWKDGLEPYYPINNDYNLELIEKYKSIQVKNTLFGGRLGEYKYYDMDKTILAAEEMYNRLKNNHGE